MKDGGVFFESVTGDFLCVEAMESATQYSKEKNEEEQC